MSTLRPLLLAGALAGATVCPAGADGATWWLDGFLALRGGQVESQPSWTTGGFGRLGVGGDAPADPDWFAAGQLQAALDWQPSPHWRLMVHGLAREGPEGDRGDSIGLVEGWIEGRIFLRTADEIRIRAGTFFLPTSKENVDRLWASPYTLTWSAINTWIGEDVRPTGLSVEGRFVLPRSGLLTVGATAFGENDTQGTLLAWRGWSMGDRLGTWGEAVPLPPNDALQGHGVFYRQRDDGSQPFGSELDDRLGGAGWVRWSLPDRASLQWTRLDNRGDRLLIDGEYAWETSFDLVGADLHVGDWSLAAEWMRGETGMGRILPDRVSQMDFEAAYLLASWGRSGWRLSVRRDEFEIDDRDINPIAVLNDERGDAWTAAAFWEPRPSIRLGAEIVVLEADRREALLSGADPDTDGRLLQIELRWFF